MAARVKVGDRVSIGGVLGTVRSIGYSGGNQLVANVDMDDGRLCIQPAASLTPSGEAAA